MDKSLSNIQKFMLIIMLQTDKIMKSCRFQQKYYTADVIISFCATY